jgi:hypothetical protein
LPRKASPRIPPLKGLAIESLALIELISPLEDRLDVVAANTADDFPTLVTWRRISIA